MTAKNIIIFASGAGSNTQNIIDFFRNDPFVKIGLIVSNKADAGVLKIAESEGIHSLIIEKEQFFKGNAYVETLQHYSPDLIVLAGFLWKIPLKMIESFSNKIINIHPALLPKYGGKGMYGHFVHEAVIAAREKETGITIHLVDELYDHGTCLFQAKVEIAENDTPESIAQKVHQLEYKHFPEVIQNILFKKK